MTIARDLQKPLLELAGYYPVTAITGPRQSGKTTLSQQTFPDKAYISLEPLDNRNYATEDPRGFLDEYAQGAIIDEVQHAPDLLSYIQDFVDRHPEPGRFILTGSQNLQLSQSVSQSLAGRCGLLTLLPPSWQELQQFDNAPNSLLEALWQGHYPRIYDRIIPAERWLADYISTYVQRDVRQVTQITDLAMFNAFLKRSAGHTGQELNYSSMGNDVGITHNTARAWSSVLDTSWLTYSLPAWHKNIRKQIVKSPKLHFVDTGLVCHLLGIRSAEELRHHPLRGAIFESWVVADVLKQLTNQGKTPNLYHYRESRGLEVDILLETAGQLDLIEVKAGSTINKSFFSNLLKFIEAHQTTSIRQPWLVYGGDQNHTRQGCKVRSWTRVADVVDA